MLHTRWSETNEHIQPSEKLHCLLPCRSMPVSLDDSPPTFSEQSSDLIGLTGTGVGPEPLQWSYLSKQYHLNCVERGIHQVDLYAEQSLCLGGNEFTDVDLFGNALRASRK
jgi:hypothetical protein